MKNNSVVYRLFILGVLFLMVNQLKAYDVIHTREGKAMKVVIQKMDIGFVGYKLMNDLEGEIQYISSKKIQKIDFDGETPYTCDYTLGENYPEILRLSPGKFLIQDEVGNRRDYANYLKEHSKEAYSHYAWGTGFLYSGIALGATSIVSSGVMVYHQIKGNEEVDNAKAYARSHQLPNPQLDTYGSHQNDVINAATISAISGIFGATFIFVGLYQRQYSYTVYLRNRYNKEQAVALTPYVGINQVGLSIQF